MSDTSEKHFDPTPSRLARAKREGNVARASEFSANAAFAGAVATLPALVPLVGGAWREAFADATAMRSPLPRLCVVVACAVVPAIAGAGAAVAAGIAQSGGLHVAPISIKLERINPIEGFKRMFSRESVTHAIRAVAAVLLAGGAVALSLPALFALSRGADVRALAEIAWAGSLRVALVSIAVGGAFACAEFGVARMAWLKKLRMSFAEFKREAKENDGDPLTRGRRKSFHRALVRGALSRVKDAAFVVVNPTHVAVALEYAPPDVPVPVVLVRAVDEGALRLRALANEHRVPIVENVALARALYAQTSVGEAIPHAHYLAVAQIVASFERFGTSK